MNFLKRKRFAITAALLLTAFTAYTLLDTFVIPHSYTVVETASGTADSETAGQETAETSSVNNTEKTASADGKYRSGKKGSGKGSRSSAASESESSEENTDSGSDNSAAAGVNATVSDNSYSDGSTTITLSEYRVQDTAVYVADVQVSSASALKTALAENTYGRNITAATSEIAADAGAILAINGDYYGARTSGYVIRNGVLYRDKGNGSEDLVIYADGSFAIISEDDVTARELLDAGAVQVLSFGPGLVENGEVTVDQNDEVGRAKASNPRTAIGIIEENHYVFVVSDGRTDESEGLSIYELAEFMQSLGVSTAYNLDGGGSSTMVFNGTVINNPTTGGSRIKERSVSDIVYIG